MEKLWDRAYALVLQDELHKDFALVGLIIMSSMMKIHEENKKFAFS